MRIKRKREVLTVHNCVWWCLRLRLIVARPLHARQSWITQTFSDLGQITIIHVCRINFPPLLSGSLSIVSCSAMICWLDMGERNFAETLLSQSSTYQCICSVSHARDCEVLLHVSGDVIIFWICWLKWSHNLSLKNRNSITVVIEFITKNLLLCLY